MKYAKQTTPIKEGSFQSRYNHEALEECTHCGSLHLIEENYDTVCKNCGSKNYTTYTNIFKWLDEQISKNKNNNAQH